MNVRKYDFEQGLEDIISQIRGYYHPRLLRADEKLVREAYAYAREAHEGQTRFSGEDYFVHPVEATKILLTINPDVETVAACLLHDVIEDTSITAEEVGKRFGERVQFLCEGVEKVAKVKLAESDWQQKKCENFQKLFIAMAQDMRVIFVKLADRIHNLRTLSHVRPDKQVRIARESLEVYASVADQMGLYGFKSEIEDLSFKILEPERHALVSSEFHEIKKARKKYIEQARREMLKAARAEGFSDEIIQISGREKNVYSVHKKMKRKHLDRVEDIFDLLGIRVVVKSKADCYRALGMVHGHWRPISGRFKDYISVPKANGYQSLHTTVLGLGQSSIPTEIQIRTDKMNVDAEFGPAAHWAYKKTGASDFDSEYLAKTAWLPRKLQKHEPLSPEQYFEEVSQAIFSERVHVFTPKGDLKFLSRGATPIDFAYAVHTEVGNTCVGALVNGVIRPLDTALKNGDVAEILTKKGRLPNAQWLTFIRSSNTRYKIMSALRKAGIEFVQSEQPQQEKQAKPSFLESVQEVFAYKSTKHLEPRLVIGGETELAHRFATCCKPVPTKPLVAYKSRGLQFVVHDSQCEELRRLDPERMFEAYFLVIRKGRIDVRARLGMLRDCTEVFAQFGMSILHMRLQRILGTGGILHFELGATREEDFEKLEKEILKIQGVKSIELLT